LLEALASRVPVVLLKNDSNIDIKGLEDAVLFVDAANMSDLHNAVKIIQENGERRKDLISRGYVFALAFQKEKICDKFRKSYLEIADK
jgi:glycosyltransferase involved in cell wall biosynthesis